METSQQTPKEPDVQISPVESWHAPLNKVTLVSKILAAVVFIVLPFVGFWLGQMYAPSSAVPVALPVSEKVEGSTISVDAVKERDGTFPTRKEFESSLQKPEEFAWAWPKIAEKEFVYQGEKGRITQHCYAENILYTNGKSEVCLGKGAIVLTWKGKSTIVDFFSTPTLAEVFFVHNVGFNEGHFSAVAESDKPNASLVIIKDHAQCITADGMCLSNFTPAYKIDMSSLASTRLSMGGYFLYSTQLLSWNAEGTRAVMISPCPAGCGENEVLGLDFVADKHTVFTKRDGVSGMIPGADGEEISWVDADTVRIRDKEYNF